MENITNKIRLYNCDCMEYMKDIPDNYYDLAIVDPPYGINITKECMGGRMTVSPDKNKNWDAEVPKKEYFDELFRISKNQVIFGGNYFSLPTSRYFAFSKQERESKEPKFKNGDILLLTSNCGFEYIAIFKEMDNDIIYIYTSINIANNRFVENKCFFRDKMSNVRKADYDEQERLFKELANQKQLRWNAEELKFEKYRWRAEHGERYWHITELGTVISSSDYYSPYDNILYNLRNYFKTEKLANQALPKWEEFFKNLNL